jgi:hypothetical protein
VLKMKTMRKGLMPVMTGMMMAAVSLTTAGLLVPVSAEAQTQSFSADSFPGLKKFLSLPKSERDKADLIYFVKIKRGSLSQVSMTLTEGGNTQRLTIMPDGRIFPLPTLAQMNNGARITVTSPEGVFPSLRGRSVSTLPQSTVYDASALRAGLDQSNRVSAKVAGAMTSFLPKLDQVFFVGATSATAVMADGSSRALPATEPNWSYPQGTPIYVPDAMPGVVSIRLNTAPIRVIYGEAVK